MTDAHEAKYREMQKYIPFIQKVIEKLKVNNEHQDDNPRRAQLQKMEMLHDLLTNKHKKIKIETLMKCEGVLIKLRAKIEKNEDIILDDVKLKQQTTVSVNNKAQELEDIGPASPPPEVIHDDDDDQPVVIPTERRCSPVLVEETVKTSSGKLHQQKKETIDSQHSTSTEFEILRKKTFHFDKNAAADSKRNSSQDKKALHQQKPHHDSRITTFHKEQHHHTKETENSKHIGSNKPKEKNGEANKLPASGKNLQTVKVIITEPLPAHIKNQHFPSHSKYLPRSSICHNNLKTLPQAIPTKNDFNEAYTPEELWEKHKDLQDKRPRPKPASTAPVFSRLGSKVNEDSAASCSTISKPTGRYTPIPDVLKSPPLSVSDINNLLMESGADKVMNDISKIGSRRPPKNEDKHIGSSNSLDFLRRKLVQSARTDSLHSEKLKLQTDKKARNTSPLPHERIALKYNPHPRHERLQSVSSTEGSECSSTTPTRISDPRIKLKLQQTGSLFNASPTQAAAASNVNVLPAINLSDPRLKKSLPATSSPNMGFPNENPISYGSRTDPRISRIPTNTYPIRTTPTQRPPSTNQTHYSSEENWDSDEEVKPRPPIKNDPRLAKKDIKNVTSNEKNELTPSRFQLEHSVDKLYSTGSEKEASAINKLPSQNNVNGKQVQNNTAATVSKKAKNKLIPATTFVVPNPPKSDTEDDWDSDGEMKNYKSKAVKADVPQMTVNKSTVVPTIAPYHTQISPKSFVNPMNTSIVSMSPIHVSPISQPHPNNRFNSVLNDKSVSVSPVQVSPVLQPQPHPHPHHHNLQMQNSAVNNRFNSILNDKSERIKYFEAKKQKSVEPRTYKEFREAKERALAQEAAIKRAADEAVAKKKAQELQELHKNKESKEIACDKKDQQINTSSKNLEEDNKEKQLNHKDNKKPSLGESTLDKMYRTQNFNSKLPKANAGFKIPKKKTEEQIKEEAKTNEALTQHTGEYFSYNQFDKIKAIHSEPSTTETKSLNQDFNEKDKNKKLANKNQILNKPGSITDKHLEINKSEEKQEESQSAKGNSITKAFAYKEKKIISDKPNINDKTNENQSPKENLQTKGNLGKQKQPQSSDENSITEENRFNDKLKISDKTEEKKEQSQSAKGNTVTKENLKKPEHLKSFHEKLIKKEKLVTNKPDKNDKLEEKQEQLQSPNENSTKKENIEKQKPSQSSDENSTTKENRINDKTENENRSDGVKAIEDSSTKTSREEIKKAKREKQQESSEKSEEHVAENIVCKSPVDDMVIVRDPRCRPKPIIVKTEDIKQNDNFNMFGDIVITSSENQVILKPQQNLDKFNKLTENLAPKPQRILRRRNTMVVFDSAPLVDKEKLRTANALLFEDVQEEEKRKRKQAEEDRLIARRNKNLEEMFKRTDDNCTVSTQNIITGKRRTRASINFNETANTKNLYKQKAVKEFPLVATPPGAPAPSIKGTRSNFKIKLKNLDFSATKDDESSDNESLQTIARREAKLKLEAKGANTKPTKLKDETKNEFTDTETKPNAKLGKKRAPGNKRTSTNNSVEDANIDVKFRPIQIDEHQNCAVSSTSTDNCNVEGTTPSSTSTSNSTSTSRSFKNELDDNEPTSTASKSNNSTPTPEQHVLTEIVDQILKPNADREHILGLLGQILNEEKLELIKSLMESSNKQNEDNIVTEENEEEMSAAGRKTASKNKESNIKEDDDEEDERVNKKPIRSTSNKVESGGKKMTMPKKKRTELDRLNEDIRDMFICAGVLTATGRRMCTIMGKDVDSASDKKPSTSTKESTPVPKSEPETITNTRKEKLKPPLSTRHLRRSVRCNKTTDENDDDEAQSIISRTTDESFDDDNSNSTTTDTTPQRKMPVLKPHTPIKMKEEVKPKDQKTKQTASKRKFDSKISNKAKKYKAAAKEETESEEENENDSDTEAGEGEGEVEVEGENNSKNLIKNTNVHWHNQSKYTSWCMVCEKKIANNVTSFHYKIHHRENYLSRMAPVILQKFKQGKLNQPLFGVKKLQKQQPTWFYRCPFCLKYFNLTMLSWLDHFQNHTAELRYECSTCHRCSNRKLTISRHLKKCRGATIITSAVKLNVTTPSIINAHVCHLCNFVQLKRVNLERHYIEQHQLETKTVDLLGYIIKLLDVENVDCVSEETALEKERAAWKSIEENEQVIDIDDDEESNTNSADKCKENKEETVTETEAEAAQLINPINQENASDKNSVKLQETKETAVETNANEIEAGTPQRTENSDELLNLTENQQRQEKKAQVEDKKETNKTDLPTEADKLKSFSTVKQQTQTEAHSHLLREDQEEKTPSKHNKSTKIVDSDENVSQKEVPKKGASKQEKSIKIPISNTTKVKRKKNKSMVLYDLIDSDSNDCELIQEQETVQTIQDELLVLAAEAAEKEDDEVALKPGVTNENEIKNQTTNQKFADADADADAEAEAEAEATEKITANDNHRSAADLQTSMSDIISSSIDMIYNRDGGSCSNKRKSSSEDASEAKKACLAASNVFMPTREENNYSPTIQILAQSIINIEDQGHATITDKPITMAERLSQRFKDLQNEESSVAERSNIDQSTTPDIINKCTKENAFDKLINDTLLELTKERDSATKLTGSDGLSEMAVAEKPKENAFAKLFNETVLEFENDDDNETVSETTVSEHQQTDNSNISNDMTKAGLVTVISDDEDWEDIEITETAPSISATGAGNMQKSKNKGLFQKFGIFKGNNTKSKKHLPSLVYLPKKKSKEKSSQSTTTAASPSPSPSPFTATPTVATATATAAKVNEITANNNSNNQLGFKPVINIMDGLFPDSPSNDPIDLVPELAPLEPLQDLNDISSILDSNLSAININAADNHTSIEDALDFISEQQANDKEMSNSFALKTLLPSQSKTIVNNISHVGFSMQTTEGNAFKFYCLLQNCSFLYSSDAIGLETHFMCEHSHIKWNGYCLMCQSQCFPSADASEEHSIAKEIRHMTEKHANKQALDLNTDSTQHSTTSSHDNEERPKIKLRRLTGDCLSRATPENVASIEAVSTGPASIVAPNNSLLGALLVAEPRPPTKEMPPQLQIPLTEPLLLNNSGVVVASPQLPFRNVNNDFLITSVTSSSPKSNQQAPPIQISSVISLNNTTPPTATLVPPATDTAQMQIPKISNVRTLATKAGNLWSQQIEQDREELSQAAQESLEVSRILENAGRLSTVENREESRSVNDSPVLVAETMPIAQSKTGAFVVTQTVSAQYNEFSSTAVGFNISIAATTTGDTQTSAETIPPAPIFATTQTSIAPGSSTQTLMPSRQYKCMGTGCKFVSRVQVAMSDHLRFHERRNLSNKRDYLSCGFCFYCAADVDDYMKHANQFHIIGKSGTGLQYGETDTATATSLTQKIQNILNSSSKGATGHSRYSAQSHQTNQTMPVHDTEEVYLKKLRETIDEIVRPTGLAEDKLYRCVIKNCYTQLTESSFLSHIMFHISATGGNYNNYVFKCPHCSAQYHRAAGIKAHIKNHARNHYFCYLCDETSTNPGQLLKHFTEKHWHTLNMYTNELLKPKTSTDGSDVILDSSYFVAYTQDLSAEEIRKFGEKLILEWQRKKSGSKTHFKSTEIDLLPLPAIFQREVNCGECEYKTKVRTNMFRHLLMHKQNPGGTTNKTGASNVCNVDPVNPVPCLNSSERFFDKMTNLASSSLIPSSSSGGGTVPAKASFKIPYCLVEETKRYTCGCQGCTYRTISEDLFRTHLLTQHTTAMAFSCSFCQEEICKKSLTIDRIINHTRFHTATIYRCEECNYVHHMRYVVERHVNEKHSTMKVNIITHNRSSENPIEGTTTATAFAGRRYKEAGESNQTAQTSCPSTRSTNSESCGSKPAATTYVNSAKGKGKWICDSCGQRTSTVTQMQTHCQQQHGGKNQYKCAYCNFGSHQLSQILTHIDEKHSGKTREARRMYHKTENSEEEVAADTRPLWQRNDPTRVRHIRGILMEDEEESEEYRKKLALTEDVDEDSNEDKEIVVEENEDELHHATSYITDYEFGCYHCSFKSHSFEDLKNQHYNQIHNSQLEIAKPFWYRLHRRLCCPECRSFLGSSGELQQHLQITHKKTRFYAADIRMAEYDDTSQRILCGYCSFHCANTEHLYRHHIKAQHWPQDIRIDNNEQIMEILKLGKADASYQCTLCSDIFSNRVAIVQHACSSHGGEDSFSFREITNSLIYRCNSCCFTSTTEKELLRHTIDHYRRFKFCQFCSAPQTSFNGYMQHCYAEHRNEIQRFRTIYPFADIKKFLLQTLIIFPNGLVLNKRNLLNTKYGKTYLIIELYEDIYKISQQPPIPRLSIARLVARKSIEAQQKQVMDGSATSSQQDEILEAMQQPLHPKPISKRRCTVAFSNEDLHNNSNSLLKQKVNKTSASIAKRRTTLDHDQSQQHQHQQQSQQQQSKSEFNVPVLQLNKISKRRRTVAVDRDTLFSSNLMSSTNSLLIENTCGKKRSSSYTHADTQTIQGSRPFNLDMEPFSFYGQKSEELDLTKIYTKVAIGGIKTPLTIDKFKLLFDIECQLKLTKCDDDIKMEYNDYRHIQKPCPASHKFKFNEID